MPQPRTPPRRSIDLARARPRVTDLTRGYTRPSPNRLLSQ